MDLRTDHTQVCASTSCAKAAKQTNTIPPRRVYLCRWTSKRPSTSSQPIELYNLSRFKTSLIETHTKVCEWGAQVNVRVRKWMCEWGVRVNVRVCEWGVRVNVRVCEWGVRVNVRVCEWLYECLPVPVHFHMFIFKAIYFEEYRLKSAHVQI